jgi:cytochrome c-type biogenesis protein CcmH/NrfG
MVVTGAVVCCVYVRQRQPAPPGPPTVELAGADPEVAQAVEEAREAVRKAPRSSQAWGRLGMVLAVHDFHADAVVALGEAERLDPTEARWPYLQGKILEQGHPEQALRKLRRAVELSGQQAARVRFAKLLLAQGYLNEAETEFRQAEQADPQDPRALLGLAQVARARNDVNRCLELLPRVLGHPWTRKGAHVLLAEVYTQVPGKEAEGERIRLVTAGLPDDAGWPDPYAEEAWRLQVGKHARIKHADTLLEAHRLEEATALLHDTTLLYPDYDQAWLSLGKALLQSGNFRGAEHACREAIRCGPGRSESHFELASALYCQRGHRPDALTEAASAFREAAQLAPTDYRAHHGLGLCLQEQGDPGQAVSAYRAALGCRPDYPEAHRYLGQLLAEIGRQAAAAARVQRLVGCPAVIDVALPIQVEALAHVRYAAQRAPHDPVARQALDQLRTELPLGPDGSDEARPPPS